MTTKKKNILGAICLFAFASLSSAQSIQVGKRVLTAEERSSLMLPNQSINDIRINKDVKTILRPDEERNDGRESLTLWPSKVSSILKNDGKNDGYYLPDRGSVFIPLDMTPKKIASSTFVESWESYDGTSENWIPTNWSKQSKGEVVPTNIKNKTWYIRDSKPVTPTDGKFLAWINFDASKEQNEWLISPSFTPQVDNLLAFDLYYSPFYMYYENYTARTGEWKFNFAAPKATMQLYVSIDNGNTWTLLWDLHNLVPNLNSTNIHSYTGQWKSFRINLDNYINKNIKIAFCYKGKNGDSMALDNIGLDTPTPEAKYRRPAGYFYAGISEDFYSLSEDLLLGHAYSNAKWINQSNEESREFSWTFPTASGNGTIISNEKEPEVYYPDGMYEVPTLKAETLGKTSTYSWGTTTPSFFQAGGSLSVSNSTQHILFGAGNYDINEKISYFPSLEGYAFGTTLSNSIDAVANYFEKPTVPYVINNIWVSLAYLDAPAGHMFELIIHRVTENENGMMLGDTIARAYCDISEALGPIATESEMYYSMPFGDFEIVEEGGFTSTGPVEINEAILVEVKGFNNNSDVLFAAFGQAPGEYSESNAYVFQYSNGIRRLTRYVENTSLLFNLGVVYTYFIIDNNVFEVPASGGEKKFNITTNVNSDYWWFLEDLPEWLAESFSYDNVNGKGTLTLKATSLPQDVESRSATLNLKTYGSGTTINVIQKK